MPAQIAITLNDGTGNILYDALGIYPVAAGAEARWRYAGVSTARLAQYTLAHRFTPAVGKGVVDKFLVATDVPLTAVVDGKTKLLYTTRWATFGYVSVEASLAEAQKSYALHRNALANADILAANTYRLPMTS